ncbi:MFS general substrate transporter [Meredithblackwellia eburnea MCA 4105]
MQISEKDLANDSSQHLESPTPARAWVATEDVHALEDQHDLAITQEDIDFIREFEASPRKKKLMRKMDIHIVPVLLFIYLISFIDRGNIGNAKIQGLTTDLHLTGQQYNWCLTVFFFIYVACEVPSNLVIKFIRPSIWIPIIMVLWGTVMTLQGIVRNYHGLLATRALLGLTEAGFFPAAMFIISNWCLRHEVGTRVAYLYGTAAAAGAFSGILAFGIAKLNKKAGLSGWQWIFIVEGMFTVVCGFIAPFFVPDSIEQSRWLDVDEKRYLARRIHLNRAGKDKGPFKWLYVRQAFGDYKTWMFGFAFFSQGVATYGLSFSLPSIIKALGYTAAQAQLLTIPPYALAALTTIGLAMVSDKSRKRYIFIVGPWMFAAVGLIICLAVPQPKMPGVVLFGVFLLAPGLYSAVPALVGWCGNSAGGEWKRGLVLGAFIAMGSAGGLPGSNIFLVKKAPRYPEGYGTCLGMLIAGFIDITILYFILRRENARRDAMDEGEIRQKYTQEELDEMGDESPLFRYEL